MDTQRLSPHDDPLQVLYIVFGCPWAHRTNIVRSLKGLEDIIQLVVLDYALSEEGWYVFTVAPSERLYRLSTCQGIHGERRHRPTRPSIWIHKN